MFGLIKKKLQPVEVVDMMSPTLKSIQGQYFIGQTESLTMEGQQQHAWGRLFNPADSGINLFFDVFTITNFSGQFYNAEIWLHSKLPGKGRTSSLVHPANLTLKPLPEHKAELQYGSQIQGMPMGGINVFNRIAPPGTTFISDSCKGGIIIPPGGSLGIFLNSPGPFQYESRIGFSWWEEKASAGGPL